MSWKAGEVMVRHCFTLLRYDRESGEWTMEKAPVYHTID